MSYTAVLNKEYEKQRNARIEVENRIAVLPKGNIQPKNIRGLIYYYLQFREGKTVKTVYIPKKEVPDVERKLKERKKLEQQLKRMLAEEEKVGALIGKHVQYKPVKNINNDEYALFMSSVAHDYKRMKKNEFLKKYQPSRFRGVQKKYVKGFTDWVKGSYEIKIRKGNDLILDPYTYYMYFEAGDKNILQEELKSAIPEFLNQGLLITNVQEAVHTGHDCIEKQFDRARGKDERCKRKFCSPLWE